MKIAVAIASEPFQQTPQLRLAEQLVEALERHGEQSQMIKLPIDCRDADTLAQSLLALRLLHVRNVDRLVALGFAACSIQHADKCAWLLEDLDREKPLTFDLNADTKSRNAEDDSAEDKITEGNDANDYSVKGNVDYSAKGYGAKNSKGELQNSFKALNSLLEKNYRMHLLECKRFVDSFPRDTESPSIASSITLPRLDIQLSGGAEYSLAKEDWNRIVEFLTTETTRVLDPT
jgi:hypothetical protein